MSWVQLNDLVNVLTFLLLLVMFVVPPALGLYLYWRDRRQSQHAVLRNFPLLGRIRYIFEQIGPELRQYLFDADLEGKPFSRDEYRSVVFAGKYMKSLISFGSKRDFEAPGWYLRNGLFPTRIEDLEVDHEPSIDTRRYVTDEEGLFSRREHTEPVRVAPWTLAPQHAPTLGADLPHPWVLRGLIGMSAMSYGALGRNAIRAIGEGIGLATGSWLNTGEGGLSDHHLASGADIVFQIGPGMFGVRDASGSWSWEELRRKAAIAQVRGFELKLHQGAKIRGGHVEGAKVTEEIAAIRLVPVGRSIDSPNRFPMLSSADDLVAWIARMRAETGKPVGVKIVMGAANGVDELLEAMARHGSGPDWITVDGGEGGSGATYREMADSMGLPLFPALVSLDDALRRSGLRERVKIFASGKLTSPDRIALALCFGADAVNIARGLMISVGCIQAQKCHTNKCPVGVATTDEKLMQALVIEEKRYRVLNYITTLRAGLASLTAAAGLRSPTQLDRRHAVYRDSMGRVSSAAEIFPHPDPSLAIPGAPLDAAATVRAESAKACPVG